MSLGDLLDEGRWTTPPVDATLSSGELHVTCVEGSDAWRTTSYGFIHDTEHALLRPFTAPGTLEVSFMLDYAEQFDQAGVFLRASDVEWIKAGVEVSDGVPQVGAVVTHTTSDWSVAPVPDWVGREVTIRASREGDAVTVRARVEGEDFRLVRVAHLGPQISLKAGLYCCAPTRAGLSVRFTRFDVTAADAALH